MGTGEKRKADDGGTDERNKRPKVSVVLYVYQQDPRHRLHHHVRRFQMCHLGRVD